MRNIYTFLEMNPLLTLFIVLSAGYFIGRKKIRTFTIGATIGVLLVGLMVGEYVHVSYDHLLKNLFFDFFIFIVGYEVGPSFFKSLKTNGWKLMLHSFFFCVVSLVTAIGLFNFFSLTIGQSIGIVAGSLTQSSILGTASLSIEQLPITEVTKQTYTSQAAIAYAITYIFGTVGIVLFLKTIAPFLLRVNLKKETNQLLKQGEDEKENQTSFVLPSHYSFFTLPASFPNKKTTVSQLEKKGAYTFFIAALCRDKTYITCTKDTQVLPEDELIVLIQNENATSFFHTLNATPQSETLYAPLPLIKTTLMLTKALYPIHFKQMAKRHLFLLAAKRENKEIKTIETLQKDDKITLIGTKRALSEMIPKIGYEIPSSYFTDIAYLTLGLLLGYGIGSLVFHIGKIPIGLGQGGGCLFSGLLLGFFKKKNLLSAKFQKKRVGY